MDLKENAKVGIVAGSKSDQETVDKITAVLDQFGIVWEFNILSAHRTPNATAKYAREAAGRGLQVLIGVAGLAAALPGVLAGTRFFRSLACPARAARSTASMHCTPSCRCPRESRWQQSASVTARTPVTSPPTSSPSQTRPSVKSSLPTARASAISKANSQIAALQQLGLQNFGRHCEHRRCEAIHLMSAY